MNSYRSELIAQGKNLLQRLNWRPRWWPSFKEQIDWLVMLGVVAIIVGIFLIATRVGLLQVAGGALLGTALALISSTIAGRQAVRQQYAKEANLARKRESYVPLHDELIKLHNILEEAYTGKQPFPKWIKGADEEPARALYSNEYNPATFELWPGFKNDSHANDFSKEAHSTLDEVFRLATAYNATIALTHQPSIDLLTPHIAKAVQAATKEKDFQEWEQRRQPPVTVQQGDDYFQWIANNSTFLLTGSTMDHDIAFDWIERDGALEWLITGHLDEAASCVNQAYRLRMTRPPELIWIRAIFQAAWPELEGQAHYYETRTALESLLKQVGVAKLKLEDGLLYIRDNYEGGAPPV
jgi:hypothetical protein